jgi:hypothetical protein
MAQFDKWGPMTVLMVFVAVVIVVAGAILVVTDSYTDDFTRWVNDLVYLAGAIGLLGIGRGIQGAGKAQAKAKLIADPEVDNRELERLD